MSKRRKLLIAAIRENPSYLQHVRKKNQTYEMCKIAVDLDPATIEYVELAKEDRDKLKTLKKSSETFKLTRENCEYLSDRCQMDCRVLDRIKSERILDFIRDNLFYINKLLSIGELGLYNMITGIKVTEDLKNLTFTNTEALRQDILRIYVKYADNGQLFIGKYSEIDLNTDYEFEYMPRWDSDGDYLYSCRLSRCYVECFGITDDFIKITSDSIRFITKLSDFKTYLLHYIKYINCSKLYSDSLYYTPVFSTIWMFEKLALDLKCYKMLHKLPVSRQIKLFANGVRISTRAGEIPIKFWIIDMRILYNG